MTNFASQLRASLGVKDGTIPKERASNAYSVADMALQYQPIVATDTGTLAGLEALVRWQDPVKGLLAAGEFIHGLSISGFRSQLAPWVVGSACSISRAWSDQSLEPPPITVNFATFEVNELPVDRMLAQALTDTGIAPDRVLIEIPGGALVPASIALRNKLRAIQDMDVQLVADISELDLDGLATALDIGVVGVTVDVPTVAAGAERRKRAQAVATRVREHGIVLTGKRADSIDEIETARELRCQRVLGYAFGAPLSETECAELLANVIAGRPAGAEGDSRSTPRAPLLLRAIGATREARSGETEQLEAMLTDLGEHGVQLRTDAAVEVGDTLQLQLRSDPGAPVFELEATVVGVERLGATHRVNARLSEPAPPSLMQLTARESDAA